MGIRAAAIIDGHHDPLSIARFLARQYGAQHAAIHLTHHEDFLQISFKQRYRLGQEKMRPWERSKQEPRTLSVFLNDYCACDYKDVTTDPATLFSLGWSGDSTEILVQLCLHFGGWFRENDFNGEYVRINAISEEPSYNDEVSNEYLTALAAAIEAKQSADFQLTPVSSPGW